MRASVILEGVDNLPENGELTAKQVVLWIIEALDITTAANIPDFTINSDGRIDERELWLHLQTAAEMSQSKLDLALKNKKCVADMHHVFRAVGSVFDATIERENIFLCWSQVCRFLCEWQKQCLHNIFMLVTSQITATLLNKFVAIPDFHKDKTIMDSISFCWKCGTVLAVALVPLNTSRTCRHLLTAFLDAADEFFNLIGRNLIFASNALFHNTKIMLDKRVQQRLDAAAFSKYLEALHFMLQSTDPDVENVIKYCTAPAITQYLVNLLVDKKTLNNYQRLLSLEILTILLNHTRKANVLFDCDWTKLFTHILYSTDAEIRKSAMELFLLVTERTERNEAANPYTRLEKAIDIYQRHNDFANLDHSTALPVGHAYIKNFIEMYQSHEDFVTCEKLFQLLRKHVSDRPAMCIVIILAITYAATEFAKEPLYHDRHVNLVKEVLCHVECVKPYPHLLYRLINIIDVSKAKNNETFHEQISSMNTVVLKAFFRCDRFGTAVELLEILKKLGFDDVYKLICDLIEFAATGRVKEEAIYFWAASEVFDIFRRIRSEDRLFMLRHFKGIFQEAPNVELKGLLFALIVDMLAAFNSSTEKFPDLPSTTIQIEAFYFYERLYDDIRLIPYEENRFASILLGTAACVYYISFNNPTDAAALHTVLRNLACTSFEYHHSFEADANRENAKDLRLLTKFWRSAIKFYQMHEREPNEKEALPSGIFQYYLYVDVHLVALVEEFIGAVLRHGGDSDRYESFTRTVRECVKYTKPSKNVLLLVKKLFGLIARTDLAHDASTIAVKIFSTNLDLLCVDSDRPKTIYNVQEYLYRVHLPTDFRAKISDTIKVKIDACTTAQSVGRKNLEELSKYLQKMNIGGSGKKRSLPISDPEKPDEPEVETAPRSPRPRLTSNSSLRSSTSLVRINQSLG